MEVSVITPSLPARAHFRDRLSDCIATQTCQPMEWIINCNPGTIGEKRNDLCREAKGDVIVMMDDDDLYAPDYIERCLAVLQAGADVTGASFCYFLSDTAAWHYEYTGTQPYVIGSGMAFRKSVWERNRFRNVNVGEDAYFCAGAGRIVPHGYLNGMVATIHGGNTASHRQLGSMKVVDVGVVREGCGWIHNSKL